MLILLFALIGGITSQNCDTAPCQQNCIETVNSYFCSCWENYELQEDGFSCVSLMQDGITALYEGCYQDNPNRRDLQYRMWADRQDNTVMGCIQTCRNRGFNYAGLQAGDECWCGNNYDRAYNTTTECTTPCTGSAGSMCGGTNANSIYRVTRDDRYMGCFNEVSSDPDFATILWEASAGRAPSECVLECSRKGYNFAGVSFGGRCACSNSYGKHGTAGEDACMWRCVSGYASQSCGSNVTNSVFRIVRAQDYRIPSDAPAKRAEISLSDFFQYPHERGIITNRFMIYASDVVNIPSEDTQCFNGDCYGVCQLSHPEGLDRTTTDIKIRQFRIAMSEIDSFVNPANENVQRVYVYAQTFVIDRPVEFDYSVLIRARQIIIDYSTNPSAIFDHYGPEFDMYNLTEAIYRGVPSDLTFQKISFTCARMLISQTDDRSNALGWAIIDDMVRDYAYTQEQATYLNTMRAYRSEFSSIGRNDLYWLPYYSKDTYVDSLETFYTEISLYEDYFNILLNDATECSTFVDRAEDLLLIWYRSVIAEGETILRYAENSLAVSEATYEQFYIQFNASRKELNESAIVFQQGIEDWVRAELRSAILGFAVAMVKLAFGVFPCGAAGLLKDLRTVMDNLEYLEVTMENLAETVYELEQFLVIVDDMIATDDYDRYMDNVEQAAALYPMITEWGNLHDQIRIIFEEPLWYEINGAREFEVACYDFINWGEALTRSITEYANNIRRYVTASAMDENRRLMFQRYSELVTSIDAQCTQKDAVVVAFAEQNYDVIYECNEQLLQFSQAYFYETFNYEEDAYPDFSGSISDLLTKINWAISIADQPIRISSANITLTVEDDPNAPADCDDSQVCPIKKLKETRLLQYYVPIETEDFQFTNLFKIAKLFVRYEGAYSSDTNDRLRFLIEASGPFKNRKYELGIETVHEFVTRSLSGMLHEYRLSNGQTTLFTELYGDQSGMVFHMAPYTNWIISIPSGFEHIQLDQVERVVMTFEGFFEN